MIVAEETAWAAGLFEGEGSIIAKTTHPKRGRAEGYPSICLSLTTTDRDVMDRFIRVVGVGKANPYPERPNRKPAWIWSSASRVDVGRIMALFCPFLGQRRRESYEAAIVAYESKKPKKGSK